MIPLDTGQLIHLCIPGPCAGPFLPCDGDRSRAGASKAAGSWEGATIVTCSRPGGGSQSAPRGTEVWSQLGLRLQDLWASRLGHWMSPHGSPKTGCEMEVGRCAEGQEEGFNSRGKMERWGEELDGERGGKMGRK